jgi:membrane-associated phospholipid phosphatase
MAYNLLRSGALGQEKMPHKEDSPTQTPKSHLSRRRFVQRFAAAGAALSAANPASPETTSAAASSLLGIGNLSPEQRQKRAYQIRHSAALYHARQPLPMVTTNGDEGIRGYIATFSKTLPHNDLGEVDSRAYTAYLKAIQSGRPSDFEATPMGGTGKLANPQSSYAFSLEGPDAHQIGLDAPPSFSSARMAAELVEDYWLALTRDVAFADYETSPLIQQAATDMSRLTAYAGPTINQRVTPDAIFRGVTPGDLTGPYVSQFLMMPVPYGMTTIEQRYKTAAPGVDYMTSSAEWLAIQRGLPASQQLTFDSTPRYIRNGRDLGSYVHTDFSYQAVLNTATILLGFGASALNTANPYRTYKTQSSFTTFGAPNVLDMVARVSCAALKATWYHKWLLHRRIRPEAFAGRVHNHVTNAAQYPIHTELTNSAALQAVYSRFGTYFLPQAYPEGSPTHPSFPAGHAALVGAGVTVLKAFFQGSATVPNPVVAASDGLSLAPYSGPPLTIAGELNKLANNIALGRDTAGVHYRSDGFAGLQLGEAVALGILQDLIGCYTEDFDGFTITRFDGSVVTICANCIP